MPTYGVGVHDIDIDLYHSQKVCDGPSISSSGLRTLVLECPARFYAYSDLNPEKVIDTTKPALAFGRAAHALMLGEPEFHAKFVVSPYEAYTTNNSRVWRDSQTKQIVKVAELEVIQDMVKAMKKNPQVRRAFDSGAPEKSMIWQHKPTGVWLKSRPDWMPFDPAREFMVEYKTAGSIRPQPLSENVYRYGYHLQAAMFLDGLMETSGIVGLGVAHVCQEKDPPYLAELRMFTNEQIAYGRRQYLRGVAIFAECLKTGKWPGYTSEPQFFDTPFHIQKKMEQDLDDGDEDIASADAG